MQRNTVHANLLPPPPMAELSIVRACVRPLVSLRKRAGLLRAPIHSLYTPGEIAEMSWSNDFPEVSHIRGGVSSNFSSTQLPTNHRAWPPRAAASQARN